MRAKFAGALVSIVASVGCGSESGDAGGTQSGGGGHAGGGATQATGGSSSGGTNANGGASGGDAGSAGESGGGSAGTPATGGAAGVGGSEDGFPRLGSMNIGNPKNYDEPAHQTALAKYDIAVLGMYYLWNKGGKTPAQAVSEIKAKNPKILLANYTILTESYSSGTGATKYIFDKLSSEDGPNGKWDWWARTSSGEHTDWSGGTYNAWDTNPTLFVTPDANGDRLPEWAAKEFYDRLLKDAGFDIWYFDNNFWRPRSSPDWNGDGKNDSKDDPTVQKWYRQGERAHYDAAAKIAPSMLRMVNSDSDLSGDVHPAAADPFDEYKNAVHSAFIEHAIGETWSVETWAGWKQMMAWYTEIFENLLPPKLVVLNVKGTSTDYQLLRYSLASALMNDGYFAYDPGDYNSLPWFDEYDLAGTSTTKWLGAAVDPPPAGAWMDGVYRRRFQNGMAIVNPKGNGPKTVTIEAGYRRIAGKQAPSINDGQPTTSITLKDRDGILLVKD